MTITLTCGCKAPAPKLSSQNVFANYTRGVYGLAGMLVQCPKGHGLREVK